MRNRTTLRVIVFLFLALLAPHRLCAETKPCPFDSPRAREIWDNAPQTPEMLLRVVKSLMDNPQMNGFDFGEKILGVDRAYWGIMGDPIRQKGLRLYNVPSLRPGGQKDSKRKWLNRPTPYFPASHIALDENEYLALLEIVHFDKAFCLSPTLTRKILGEPGKGSACYKDKQELQYVQNRIRFFFSLKQDLQSYSRAADLDTKKDEGPVSMDSSGSCAYLISILNPVPPSRK